jgi:hypothetical protein
MPVVHEGNLHLYAVPSIANLAVPTMAEINAGVDLTPALTADGFSPTNTENTVSTDMLTGFIKQSIGTEGIGFDLTFLREAANGGDVWSYFDARGKSHYLVVCPFAAAAATQPCEVYPVESGRRKWVASGANAHEKFTVKNVGRGGDASSCPATSRLPSQGATDLPTDHRGDMPGSLRLRLIGCEPRQSDVHALKPPAGSGPFGLELFDSVRQRRQQPT